MSDPSSADEHDPTIVRELRDLNALAQPLGLYARTLRQGGRFAIAPRDATGACLGLYVAHSYTDAHDHLVSRSRRIGWDLDLDHPSVEVTVLPDHSPLSVTVRDTTTGESIILRDGIDAGIRVQHVDGDTIVTMVWVPAAHTPHGRRCEQRQPGDPILPAPPVGRWSR